jgi:glutaredoxin 3
MVAAEVTIYLTDWCPYCARAKEHLARKKVRFTEVNVEDRPDLRKWLVSASGQRTVPQIFINNESIGGYSDMMMLEGGGELDRLLSKARPENLPALPR